MKIRKVTGVAVICLLLIMFLTSGYLINYSVNTVSVFQKDDTATCFIIDPGHGGVDGGAVSCTGKYESHINLEISLRLQDLMHFLGLKTKIIRTEDVSIYTRGESIAAKKASDLKERVRIVNETENGILLSIHQNYFSDSRYKGAQVFYAANTNSESIAQTLQKHLQLYLASPSNRKAKTIDRLYLFNHITKPGLLIECGFLSNREEALLLEKLDYQRKLCAVIACLCTNYRGNDA